MTTEMNDRGTFVVLGASGGIGTEVARQLKSAGHRVVLASRGSERLDALAAELDSPKHELDATLIADVEACFDAATESFGHVLGAELRRFRAAETRPLDDGGRMVGDDCNQSDLSFCDGAGSRQNDDQTRRIGRAHVIGGSHDWSGKPRGDRGREGWCGWLSAFCGSFIRGTGDSIQRGCTGFG